MEFEENEPVSEGQRRLAETKKGTLEPLHKEITPDDVSNSDIANSHINGQPIRNTQNETRQDASVLIHADRKIQEATPTTRRQAAAMIAAIVGIASMLIIVSLFLALSITA